MQYLHSNIRLNTSFRRRPNHKTYSTSLSRWASDVHQRSSHLATLSWDSLQKRKRFFKPSQMAAVRKTVHFFKDLFNMFPARNH